VIEVRLKHKGVIVKTIYFERFTEKIGKVARAKLTLAERKAGKKKKRGVYQNRSNFNVPDKPKQNTPSLSPSLSLNPCQIPANLPEIRRDFPSQ
jgi:hypothetical protein